MELEIVKSQRKPTQGRVHQLINKHSRENGEKTNAKRERFLALLVSRNGYSNEKAVSELERLLKEFYRNNRSSGVHHIRSRYLGTIS